MGAFGESFRMEFLHVSKQIVETFLQFLLANPPCVYDHSDT
jgi:hypothetical protein